MSRFRSTDSSHRLTYVLLNSISLSHHFSKPPMIEQLRTDQIDQGFIAELLAVEHLLSSSLERIYSPLSILVRSQIAQASPHKRASVILAVSFPADDSDELKEKRIYLAAALEMLYIALQVHQLLLNNRIEKMEDTIDKSVLGSTILAGDYCFSHAASLAAKTDSPEVVAVFSEVLQSISEYQLRSLFSADNSATVLHDMTESLPFDPSIELCKAGIQAASNLVRVPANVHKYYEMLVDKIFGNEISAGETPASALLVQELHTISQAELAELDLFATQWGRWLALFEWLKRAM